jgi:hypothetical protein
VISKTMASKKPAVKSSSGKMQPTLACKAASKSPRYGVALCILMRRRCARRATNNQEPPQAALRHLRLRGCQVGDMLVALAQNASNKVA